MEYIIIENSPVEFVICGPAGGRDSVLVKSEGAGLDLIGAAAQFGSQGVARPFPSVFSRMFNQGKRTINSIISQPFKDIDQNIDERYSESVFVWRGFSSKTIRVMIGHEFKMILPDLHNALKNSDSKRVEWIVAPIIYRCSEVTDKEVRERRVIWGIVVGYFAIAVVISILINLKKFVT